MRVKYDVFLAGPITGVPDYRERFAEAEAWAHKVYGGDARVWNPARMPEGKENRWYMIRCFIALFRSRRVVALEGWDRSRGAALEVCAAWYIGVEVEEVGWNAERSTLNAERSGGERGFLEGTPDARHATLGST